jgi:flavin reductase (DIM6/NTAB) family NADH-FMN oxidoreductase RutF
MTDLTHVLGRIPRGQFILTAAFDGARSGVLVGWVQQCATEPPMVMTAIATGLPVIPLIRDSRSFALCQISADDRLLGRKFARVPDHGEDPFVSLATGTAPSGSPIVQRALTWIDCELVRHVDLESDHGLYVGLVRAGGLLSPGDPAVLLNGEGAV